MKGPMNATMRGPMNSPMKSDGESYKEILMKN